MMVKMQNKVKDSNLRNIDHFKKYKNISMSRDIELGGDFDEETKLGGAGGFSKRHKRQRTNSINESTFANNLGTRST